jgi:hypothetical protein
MTEPSPPTPPPVTAVLPDGVAEGLVVGPGDILVVRVGPSVLLTEVETMAARIQAGPLAGRVLVVAAEQIGVVRA